MKESDNFAVEAFECIKYLEQLLNGDHSTSIVFRNKDNVEMSFVFTVDSIEDIKATLDVIKKNGETVL